MSSRYIVLDSLRGIFAIVLVLFHMKILNTPSVSTFIERSYIVIEYFFVLSGFVIYHCLSHIKNLRFKPYFIKRFLRLYPLHLFTLSGYILYEVLRYFVMNVPAAEVFQNDLSLSYLLPNLLLLHGWSEQFNPYSFNSPSWSISLEFYLYFVIYGLFVMAKENKVVILFTVFTLLLVNQFSPFINLPYLVQKGCFSFSLGAITCSLFYKFNHQIKLSKLGFSFAEGTLLLLTTMTIWFDNLPNRDLLFALTSSLLCFIFPLEKGFFSDVLKKRFFSFFADHSYSIYLTHGPILVLFANLFALYDMSFGTQYIELKTHVINFGSLSYNIIAFVFYMSVILLYSKFTYKYIEMPGKRLATTLAKKWEKKGSQ